MIVANGLSPTQNGSSERKLPIPQEAVSPNDVYRLRQRFLKTAWFFPNFKYDPKGFSNQNVNRVRSLRVLSQWFQMKGAPWDPEPSIFP